jgi:hypothetical protein
MTNNELNELRLRFIKAQDEVYAIHAKVLHEFGLENDSPIFISAGHAYRFEFGDPFAKGLMHPVSLGDLADENVISPERFAQTKEMLKGIKA